MNHTAGPLQALSIAWWPIDRPRPYPNNPRRISTKAVAKVARSLEAFGWRQPLVVDEAGEIVVGHTRLLAARQLGMPTVPVHQVLGWSDAEKRAYRIADNRTGEESEWDEDLLRIELGDLAGLDLTLTGFELDELTRFTGAGGRTDPDAVPPEPAIPVTRMGDLWELRGHRLLCGDSTVRDHLATLLGGARAQLVFTDPPYGVAYDGGQKRRERLANDEVGTAIYAASLPLLGMAAEDDAALYLWFADAGAAAEAVAASGYAISAQIVWVKNHAQFVSAAHYHGQHESCFYAHRKGHTVRWYGPGNEVSVWAVDRSSRNDFHPTQKPVALAARALRNSSAAGDVVLDLFLGGGTTLIAAEELGRRCYGMEIEPRYVDVAVRRWEAFTGAAATLHGDGRTFASIAALRGVPTGGEVA